MPIPIQTLMADCLEDEAEKRPSFEEIDVRLKRINAESANPAQTSVRNGHVSLFDIFPRHIAEALQDGRKVEAEHKDCVTIFFSDIVGFTSMSARLDPRKVANLLDRLYHKFDELSSQHDLYKVETIGDAYMAVTNLVKDQPDDHCKRIAAFAIDALKAANETLIDEDDPSKGTVNIRVGFHSGSVVADVVGNRNPRYCLFGDSGMYLSVRSFGMNLLGTHYFKFIAVNTASRMESNSQMNRINCSHHAAEILREQWPELPLRDRGEVTIKGKGKMQCFWVNEKESSQNAALERLEAKRQIRMLETSIESWGTMNTSHDVEAGGYVVSEQAPATSPSRGTSLPPLTEAVYETSGEFSLDGTLGSGEFALLEGDLKARLDRSGRSLGKGDLMV